LFYNVLALCCTRYPSTFSIVGCSTNRTSPYTLKRTSSSLLLLLLTTFLLTGCASRFPDPQWAAHDTSVPSGVDIFTATFNAHGGESLAELNDVNVSITGSWKTLIRKIQPLVTDYTYHVDSQERLLPNKRTYAALYTGPAGTKKVLRTPDKVDVHYNNLPSVDSQVLSSTALTADSFLLFLLGPLALEPWRDDFVRLSDEREKGKRYHRIYAAIAPGLGLSPRDEVVLWIDPDTNLTYKVQITLEGHDTTKGAHVETQFLSYETRAPFVFPAKFFERVNAPVSIDAHAWHLTGLDINRGLTLSDLEGPSYSPAAIRPANTIE